MKKSKFALVVLLGLGILLISGLFLYKGKIEEKKIITQQSQKNTTKIFPQVIEHQGFSFVLPSQEWKLRSQESSPDGKLTAYIYSIEDGVYDLNCQLWRPTISLIFENISVELKIHEYASRRAQQQAINLKELEKIEPELYPFLSEAEGYLAYNPIAGKVAKFIYTKNKNTAVQMIAEYPLISTPILMSHYNMMFSSARFDEILMEEAGSSALVDDVRNLQNCKKDTPSK